MQTMASICYLYLGSSNHPRGREVVAILFKHCWRVHIFSVKAILLDTVLCRIRTNIHNFLFLFRTNIISHCCCDYNTLSYTQFKLINCIRLTRQGYIQSSSLFYLHWKFTYIVNYIVVHVQEVMLNQIKCTVNNGRKEYAKLHMTTTWIIIVLI